MDGYQTYKTRTYTVSAPQHNGISVCACWIRTYTAVYRHTHTHTHARHSSVRGSKVDAAYERLDDVHFRPTLEEWQAQQLVCREAHVRFRLHTCVDDVPQVGVEGLVQPGWRLFAAERRLAHLHDAALRRNGRLQLDQLIQDQPDRPYVSRHAVLPPKHSLRAHVDFCANEGVVHRADALGDAEVGDLDISVRVDEYVAGLDIPVYDAFVVQMPQARHHLVGHSLQHFLGYALVLLSAPLDEIGQAATIHVLHHQPHRRRSVLIGANEAHQILPALGTGKPRQI
mmetsp:Transcript_32287/g.79969  ORF Transcript_32287/g.79969 Transcript_32287/m.79969 type:complete len:284 (-) Transcript_32287:426-1277(-)